MTARIIYLHKYREPTRIPPAVQETATDEQIAFARLVERRFHAMCELAEGKLPERYCEDARPCDGESA